MRLMRGSSAILKENGAGRVQPHRHGDDGQERGHGQQAGGGRHHVEGALDQSGGVGEPEAAHAQHAQSLDVVDHHRGAHDLQQTGQNAHVETHRLHGANEVEHVSVIRTPGRHDHALNILLRRQLSEHLKRHFGLADALRRNHRHYRCIHPRALIDLCLRPLTRLRIAKQQTPFRGGGPPRHPTGEDSRRDQEHEEGAPQCRHLVAPEFAKAQRRLANPQNEREQEARSTWQRESPAGRRRRCKRQGSSGSSAWLRSRAGCYAGTS